MNIIIVSYIGSPWLQDCLESIKNTPYPIYVAMNTKNCNHYETAGLQLGARLGDPFLLLQDSIVVKDISFIDTVAKYSGEVSLGYQYLMYMGKYVIRPDEVVPVANSKKEAVDHEIGWAKSRAVDVPSLWPDFRDKQVFEDKHGKKRMILENAFIKKYKNCWDTSMIESADRIQ